MAAPVLALFIGLISLMMGHDAKYQRLLSGTLVLALVAVCYLGISSNMAATDETKAQKTISSTLRGQNTNLLELLAKFKQDTGLSLEAIISKLDNWLINPSSVSTVSLKQAVLANESMEIYAADIPTNTTTQIKYYVKEIDNQTVLASLTAKGLTVAQGKATLDKDKTNAIWFGEQVSLQEVKYVAMALIRAGVQITTIKPFSGSGRKPRLIEIGSDRAFISGSAITVKQVNAAAKFSR